MYQLVHFTLKVRVVSFNLVFVEFCTKMLQNPGLLLLQMWLTKN